MYPSWVRGSGTPARSVPSHRTIDTLHRSRHSMHTAHIAPPPRRHRHPSISPWSLSRVCHACASAHGRRRVVKCGIALELILVRSRRHSVVELIRTCRRARCHRSRWRRAPHQWSFARLERCRARDREDARAVGRLGRSRRRRSGWRSRRSMRARIEDCIAIGSSPGWTCSRCGPIAGR